MHCWSDVDSIIICFVAFFPSFFLEISHGMQNELFQLFFSVYFKKADKFGALYFSGFAG